MENYSRYFRQGDLIAKYLKGELSDQEREELEDWIAQSDHNRALFTKLTQEATINTELSKFGSSDKAEAWEKIVSETGYNTSDRRSYIGKRLLRYAAAAVVVILAGLLLYPFNRQSQSTKPVAQQPTDFAPGSSKAILTLADASKIILDDVADGQIAQQADVVITKTADGQLLYAKSSAATSPEAPITKSSYNTITTPRGGKFRIILPDGSKVWLNAASSLKYPTKFVGNERSVTLMGEAYFEIMPLKNAHRQAMPFRVRSASQVVEVLGTHFNINSYADESSVKTTLLEGKVKVIKTSPDRAESSTEIILKPGEQAQLTADAKRRLNLIPKADLEEAVAWKNGQFQFKDTDLPTIMRQISRWYDVEVDFQGKLPDTKFRGKISRDVPLSQIFQILQLSGINFKIEGRKITVKS
ncbi:FecR family protein [Spirosoma litoris]